MKLWILFITCLLPVLKMNGQVISLKNVKPEHVLKNRFDFDVINTADSAGYYSISLEKWDSDNSWHEVKGDVFNFTSSKKTKNFQIPGNGSMKQSFYPAKYMGKPNRHDKYRLRANYGNTATNKSQASYSESFIFK